MGGGLLVVVRPCPPWIVVRIVAPYLQVKVIEYELSDFPIVKKTLPNERVSISAFSFIEVARHYRIDGICNPNFKMLVRQYERTLLPE